MTRTQHLKQQLRRAEAELRTITAGPIQRIVGDKTMRERVRSFRKYAESTPYINIAVSYPSSFYFKYSYEPEIKLAEDLDRHFDPTVVFVSGSGMGGGGRDLNIVIENATEMDDPRVKKQLIKEVVQIAKRSLVKNMPGLKPTQIQVHIYEDVID